MDRPTVVALNEAAKKQIDQYQEKVDEGLDTQPLWFGRLQGAVAIRDVTAQALADNP